MVGLRNEVVGIDDDLKPWNLAREACREQKTSPDDEESEANDEGSPGFHRSMSLESGGCAESASIERRLTALRRVAEAKFIGATLRERRRRAGSIQESCA